MRISTCGEWRGSLWINGHLMENPNNDHNYTYNTEKEDDEIIMLFHLRPGKTNMILDVNEGKGDRCRAIYKVLGNEDASEGKTDRRKKAVISILQVLAENELTAVEVNFVLKDVEEIFGARPLTTDFVKQYSENSKKFWRFFEDQENGGE